MERDSKRSWEGPAEKLPLEVIGDILSRVGVARDVIKASVTCKKWREASCKHLHALLFDSAGFKFPKRQGSVPDIELLITNMVYDSPALQKLSIRMDLGYKFSSGLVVAWLRHVRETLSELNFKVRTSKSVDVLDIFKRQKLESLSLSYYKIGSGELKNLHSFPCLTSLSLSHVGISVEDLNRFLNAPPKLESLKLDSPFREDSQEVLSSDDLFSPEKGVKVHCPTLKTLFLNHMKLYQFILENSSIQCLQVEWCDFSSFKVHGSTTLRDLKISDSEVWLLEIDDTENLESFEIISCTVTKSNLFPMTTQAPKLKRFRFWQFYEEYSSPVRGNEMILDGVSGIVLDLERLAICSPQLSHLAIFCDEGVDGLAYKFGDSTSLEKVTVLEIGWDGFDDFAEWAERLLKCCPNAKKVIVHWAIDKDNSGILNDLSVQSSLVVKLMSKYHHIEMQFAFSYL